MAVVTVALEHRFISDTNGDVFTNGTFDYAFWQRYLDVFDQVKVIARVKQVEDIPAGYLRSDGPKVRFIRVPYYLGPKEFILKSPRIVRTIWRNIDKESAQLLRVPGALGSILWSILTFKNLFRRRKIPYALEVVGDPHDVFSPGSVKHPMRPLFRLLFKLMLKLQTRNAVAASYVTSEVLQKRYPCRGRTFFYSSINIKDEDYSVRSKQFLRQVRAFKIVFVGTLEQLYKGPDVLLKALKSCSDRAYSIRLTVIGDGKHKAELQDIVQGMGIGDCVEFVGHISEKKKVLQYLDNADLFVLPSRQEGLPRAMVEAMARGLPCIGTTVGGIPELLPEEDLVPPNDPVALADKIIEVITDPERMNRMSERNLRKAREFSEDILRERRKHFYGYINKMSTEFSTDLGLKRERGI